MKVRPRTLPPGWYPDSSDRVEQVITDFLVDHTHIEHKIHSGIVPHAGWGFSGSIACRVISHIDPDHHTIIVVTLQSSSRFMSKCIICPVECKNGITDYWGIEIQSC